VGSDESRILVIGSFSSIQLTVTIQEPLTMTTPTLLLKVPGVPPEPPPQHEPPPDPEPGPGSDPDVFPGFDPLPEPMPM
jgi:hypothetical protein